MTVRELIDVDEPAWPLVEHWIDNAPHPVDVRPVDDDVAEASLIDLQVTVHSVLGALTYHTGGVLIDHGWLRLLGAGKEPALNVVKANGVEVVDGEDAGRPAPPHPPVPS